MQPLIDFGGVGHTLHFAPANGFPPRTYEPLLGALTGDHHVISLPPRALWPGEKPPAVRRQWDAVAEDLLAGLRHHGWHDVIAMGHSFGGIASMIAAVTEPERFRALVLLDPTIFLQEWMAMMEQMQLDGSILDFPLAQGALHRRTHFESAEAAFANFRRKALFHDWSDEALWHYVRHGTRPGAKGVELTWPAEWEAYYFCTGYTHTWELLPRLRGLLPMLVLRGESSDTFTEAVESQMRERLPDASYRTVAGHGHLFPLSAAAETARLIQGWLKDVKA